MYAANGSWPKPFREAFCRKFQCPGDAYETEVFWRCLYRHALPIAVCVYRRNPKFFKEDFDLIREVGNMNDTDTFRSEINFFYGRNLREKNWLRRTFCVRLSGKRLMRLKDEVFRNPLIASALLR